MSSNSANPANKFISSSMRLVTQHAFETATGQRPDNQDYAGLVELREPNSGIIAAIADGVGGNSGGRVAAELCVRGFLEGLVGTWRSGNTRDAAVRSLEAINRWIHAVGSRDDDLKGMSCTFTAMISRGREIHILHVGDSRLYRLRGDQLQQMTADHALGPGQLNMLTRAVGAEGELRIDYVNEPAEAHDRFLLCTDGVYKSMSDRVLREVLMHRATPTETCRDLIERALATSVGDNATAIVLDLLELPPPAFGEIDRLVRDSAILALPAEGEIVDDFRIETMLSDSRYVRVLKATDMTDQRSVVLKFPKPLEGADRPMREAFLRELWIGSHVRSPYVGETLQLKALRQTRLYLATPFYDGVTLESLLREKSGLSLRTGLDIALKVARGVAALHRAEIIHRDIKPENIIVSLSQPGQPTAVKLIDLGVAKRLREANGSVISEPGTPSFMAPELFQGKPADETSDQFSLGVTIYRLFTGKYPYGEIEPFSRPRFRSPTPLSSIRPDLPAWLDRAIGRAIAPVPQDRYNDVFELIFELENGADRASPILVERKSFYDRNPLLFWKMVSTLLALLLAVSVYAGIRH
ncbi:bifunctional protein-serine/threonine kinase/phosphatase [Bradyrhizobium oligotrophicum]|nr:bifunctional protein-serine/threonine kinase/phosphatase [Bradyrhizobium oligotrophicum]